MNRFMKPAVFTLIILAMLTAGCNAPAPVQPTQEPVQAQPTADLAATAAVLRTEVAAEIAAQMTSTALAMPTDTPEPTATVVPDTATPAPTLTPSSATSTAIPTIRIITVYPTFTPTPGPYQCQITAMEVPYGSKMPPGAEFDGRWTVRNSGTRDWEEGNVDLTYISGQKMQKRGDVFDIDEGLDTGDTMQVIVDMVAPRDPGLYHADWALRYDGTIMCYLPVDIWVVNQ